MWQADGRTSAHQTVQAADCAAAACPLNAGPVPAGSLNADPLNADPANADPVDAGVVVDIHAELAYWEQAYRASGFHRPDFCFKDYRPSLKFAYDAYLRHYRQPLQTLLPALHQKYLQSLATRERLEWERMTRLMMAVWSRLLRAGVRNAKPRAGPAGPGTELKSASRLRGTVARLRNISTRKSARPEDQAGPPAA